MLEELRYFTLPKILLGLTLTLAIILGLAVGGFQPLANALHLRTTVPYYVTLTRTVSNTIILTTTIVVNHTLTVTTTTTSLIILTSTYTNTTTVRTIITQPVTTTVTTTTATPIYYTLTTTFTETITSNNLTLPPLDIYNASSILNYLKANYSLGWFAYIRSQNVTQFGFCISTLYILPNASVIWLGAWIVPWWYAVKFMNNETFVGMLPGGYGEWEFIDPKIEYLPPGSIWPLKVVAHGMTYMVNVTNYPLPGYTVAVIGEVGGIGITLKNEQWDFQNLNNGTYVMALVQPGIGLVEFIPPGLCLVQVIRVNPNTPNSLLLNMTYWGAQYWAWVRSIAQFGKPAPCYMPWMWTIGSALYRLNITEPIGPLWQYYCGPNGIWRNLKP